MLKGGEIFLNFAVAGDTHGKIQKLEKALQMLKPDYLFFTGDYYSDGLKLARHLSIDWTGVMGNCDFGFKVKREQQITIAGYNFYLVHGHQYGVKRNHNTIYYRGVEVNADIVLFGHTHIPMCKKIEGIWLINPGSAAFPRLNFSSSYAIIETNEDSINAKIIEI